MAERSPKKKTDTAAEAPAPTLYAKETDVSAVQSLRREPALRVIVMIAGITITAFGLSAARPVVVPMLLALCVVLAVQPLVNSLEKRGAPTSVAVSGAMLSVLLGLSLFCATFVYGASELLSDLPMYEKIARSVQLETTTWFASKGLFSAARAIGATRISAMMLDLVSSWIPGLPDLLGHGVFVLILTLFALLERNALQRKFHLELSGFDRSTARIVSNVQHYLAVKTLISAMTGVAAGLWCLVWDIPNAPLWGVVAFVMNYIPVAGSILASIPPIGLAMFTGGSRHVIAVAVGYFVLNVAVGNFLEPRWLGRACGLSPLVVLMSVVIWGALLGPVGALLSVPLTSALRMAIGQVRDLKWLGLLMDHEGIPLSSRPSIPVTEEMANRR